MSTAEYDEVTRLLQDIALSWANGHFTLDQAFREAFARGYEIGREEL